MKLARFLVPLATALAGWAASSCAPTGFQGPSQITSVRIMASSADKPYAMPGDEVTVQVLAFDGRPAQPEPMTVSWIPVPCEDPVNDAYYACFPAFAAALEAGAMDLSKLPTGLSLKFQMPGDVITKHPAVMGSVAPYGLAILFNVACAGHLEPLPLDPSNVQSPPIGCFDAQHNQLGPQDYVLGFTRVYAYTDLTELMNGNPAIDSVDVDGTPVPIAGGMTAPITMARCGKDCPTKRIGPVVPKSSQEMDPATRDSQGNPLLEQVWAEYFATFGSLSDDVKLLYDPAAGSVGTPADTDDTFSPPAAPGTGFVWIVVHDNRGGASWVTVPITVQ